MEGSGEASSPPARSQADTVRSARAIGSDGADGGAGAAATLVVGCVRLKQSLRRRQSTSFPPPPQPCPVPSPRPLAASLAMSAYEQPGAQLLLRTLDAPTQHVPNSRKSRRRRPVSPAVCSPAPCHHPCTSPPWVPLIPSVQALRPTTPKTTSSVPVSDPSRPPTQRSTTDDPRLPRRRSPR